MLPICGGGGEVDGGVGEIGIALVAAEVGHLLAEREELEVFKELLRDHLHLIGRLDERLGGAGAGHGLRGDPRVALRGRGDLKFGDSDDFVVIGGGPGAGGLGEGWSGECGESERGEEKPEGIRA